MLGLTFWYDEDNYATPIISIHPCRHDECSILSRFYITTLAEKDKCVHSKKEQGITCKRHAFISDI